MAKENNTYDKKPYVVDLNAMIEKNKHYRTTIWTGENMQLIAMSIAPHEEAGLEVHRQADQFILIEEGMGLCRMGAEKDEISFERTLMKDTAIFIPMNTWHNIINTGDTPLDLYTIYSGPEYDPGTIHKTKAEALEEPLPKDTDKE
ncbi:cupin domain-containing protein [Atopococcus tabaci]|uniref:cupin domain-containing protein n=1 Tax=Atopococcus tabaci TaxID=269774 RepID=UPI000400A6FF|nr:cupin domain-containing protein [Atopococcus tabaci]